MLTFGKNMKLIKKRENINKIINKNKTNENKT